MIDHLFLLDSQGLKASFLQSPVSQCIPSLLPPVGGELRGGLIVNEYEAITAGLWLQNEVTMVTKAEGKGTAPTALLQGLASFVPELC